MSTTYDSLEAASFPDDYADILMDVLAITSRNLLSVKDALNHFRQLPDDQAADLIEHLADQLDDDDANPAPYFRGASGKRYPYPEIAERIRKEAPQTLGKPITVQLEAIGLLEEFQGGGTPYVLPSTFAEAETPLLVPSGRPLVEGKLYLRLSHGRKDPAEEMQGWGFVGPTFGPLASVQQTYLCDIQLFGANDEQQGLATREGLIIWDGSYYGDISVFVAGKHDHG
jgi:hypothetical protein